MDRVLAAALVSSWLVAPGVGWADEPSSAGDEVVVRRERGLNFKVPADWPIEERSGVVAPIPIEEYLSRKFAVVFRQLSALERRLGDLEGKQRALESRVREQEKTLGASKTP